MFWLLQFVALIRLVVGDRVACGFGQSSSVGLVGTVEALCWAGLQAVARVSNQVMSGLRYTYPSI